MVLSDPPFSADRKWRKWPMRSSMTQTSLHDGYNVCGAWGSRDQLYAPDRRLSRSLQGQDIKIFEKLFHNRIFRRIDLLTRCAHNRSRSRDHHSVPPPRVL